MSVDLNAGIRLVFHIPFLFWRSYRSWFVKRSNICVVLILLLLISFLWEFFFPEKISSAIKTRLYPDRPLTIDLRSFSICPPETYKREEILQSFHQHYPNATGQICFLIEHLDGGPWWSYVSQEFAEILVQVKEFGEQANLSYRSLPYPIDIDLQTDLRRYFLRACQIDENIPKEDQPPIILLFWDVNALPWYSMREQWQNLFSTTQIQLSIFVDDLHFVDRDTFLHRQYMFHSLATEIFSTYPYLFHNYYYDINPKKITWLAHSASKRSSTSLNQSASNLLFVSGANLRDWYPCRTFGFILCTVLHEKSLVHCLSHPGYGPNMRNSTSYRYGADRYLSYMRQFTFGLATCESVRYAIAKLFEIPGNGLALVTTEESGPILERLGLSRDEDFFVIRCSSIRVLTKSIQQLQQLPRDKVEQVRRRGQEKVHQRHLTTHRAEFLHVRLLSQALQIKAKNSNEREKWRRWGKRCPYQ